jgi:glutaredoxin
LAGALAGLAVPVAAQYKVVEPSGRISYTDRPPTDGSARVTTLGREPIATTPAPQDALPQDLRQVTTRFPVTLYSAADCPPCDGARQLLLQRGVPFSEKLIVSDADAAALESLSGARTVPTVTIGAQVLRGLSPGEWASYLDLAGYPRESKLPKGWQPAPATPLVARSAPPVPAASAPARAAARAPAPAPEVAPPSGLRF